MKRYCLLTALVLFINVNAGRAQTDGYPLESDTKIGTTYTFQSKSLHGAWKVNVKVPKGYEQSNDKYPVVYVLHGDYYFSFATGALQRMMDFGTMPASIIVGITNESNAYFAFGTKRADQFLDFIEEDVFSLIETAYRTHQDRTVLGWHYTAGFAFHVLINKPEMFENYIPASPYLGGIDINEIKFEGLSKIYNNNPNFKNSLYFGSMDNERTVKSAALSLDSLLQLNNHESLDWQFELLTPDYDKSNEVSVYRFWTTGLKTFYEEYKNEELEISDLDEYKAKGGLTFVKEHYKKRATKFGGSSDITNIFSLLRLATRADNYKVFEELMNELHGEYQDLNLNSVLSYAQFYLSNNKSEEALAMYESINEFHPNLISVHDGFAQAYLSSGQKKEAITSYQFAIELAEAQDDDRLEALKTKLTKLDN